MTPTISAKPSPWPRRRPSSPSTVHAQRSPTTTARSTKSATWSSVSSTSSSTSGVSRPDTNRLQEPTSPWSNSPPSLSGPGNCQRNLADAGPRPAFANKLDLRAAHRQAGDLQRGLPHAHRDALAVLAADADAGVEGEVVADHGDAGERRGAVADQGGALHRRAQLAVLDQVGLAALEDKLAAGGVDLAAVELGAVDAAVGGRDHVLELVGSAQHRGVGHPRHRQVGVGLAPAVAGGLQTHQPGALAIVHVADKRS